MENPFRVKISKDQLSAELELAHEIEGDFSVTVSELTDFLKEQRVVFGIEQQKLKEIAEKPQEIQYPLLIAQGTPPLHGEDAYITMEVRKEKTQKTEKVKVNFRNVMEIPSVQSGQVIANIVEQTFGTNGTSVAGKPIPARHGKPLRIRAGKNVIQNGNQFFSTIDGQVSLTDRMISINPIFEVHGDIDLKTGNIDFIGNVVIRGNVPTGYEVKAGGDIKVYGLVEGAHLNAKGNIFISGGITGGYRGTITAGGNIQATYLNQAEVYAGKDVIINSSLLHSKVQAGGSIQCKSGRIIGGYISAAKDVHVKELGNHLYTKTELNIGFDPVMDEKERILKSEIEKTSVSLKKLQEIENKLIETAREKGQLTENEKNLIIKQRATKHHLNKELEDMKRQLSELEEERLEKETASVYIYETAYPNTIFHFGKYSKSIQREHSYVKFFVTDGEISFEPIG